MSQLTTTPGSFDMATSEVFPVNIDMTAYLTGSQTVQTNPASTAIVIDQSNNQTMANAVQGSPAVNGNIVQVSLNGSQLRAGKAYTLQVTFYVTGTQKLTTVTTINVVI